MFDFFRRVFVLARMRLLGLVGLLASCYWAWHALIRPFVGSKLGWAQDRPHPKLELVGWLGLIAFLVCVVFLPLLGRAGG